MSASCNSRRRPPRRGYTLIELLVSMSTGALLLGGLASTLYISTKTLTPDDTAASESNRSSLALAHIAADLRLALNFTERTATALTFTVPDRTGDGAVDTIRYSWSGTPGDPLLYQFNAGAAAAAATNVQQLNFSSLTRTIPAASAALASTIVAYASPREAKTADEPGTSVTILRPIGLVPGNVMIAAIAVDGSVAAEMTAPAGWTLVDRVENGSQVTLAVWSRVAGVSEPADYVFSWTTPKHAYGWIMRFGGVEPTAPIDGTPMTKIGFSDSPDCLGVVTSVPNAMIVRIGAFQGDDVDIDDAGMLGHTTLTMDTSGSGGGSGEPVSGGATYKLQASTGSAGLATFQIAVDEPYVTMTLALRPDDGI